MSTTRFSPPFSGHRRGIRVPSGLVKFSGQFKMPCYSESASAPLMKPRYPLRLQKFFPRGRPCFEACKGAVTSMNACASRSLDVSPWELRGCGPHFEERLQATLPMLSCFASLQIRTYPRRWTSSSKACGSKGERLGPQMSTVHRLRPSRESPEAHLAPAVQWLMSVVAQIPLQASEVIQELCGQHVKHYLAKILDQ